MKIVWIRYALIELGLIVGLFYVVTIHGSYATDLHAYYALSLDHMYVNSIAGAKDAYLYSPAFAEVFSPLTLIPFELLTTLWRSVMVVGLSLITGPLMLLSLLWTPVVGELDAANIFVFMTLAIIIGFRYPVAWSFLILTKVTPGIGLLWFLVRKEWRNLFLALAATAIIFSISFIIAPNAWFQWFESLVANSSHKVGDVPFPVSIWIRLALAALLVIVGAKLNYRWVVPIAITVAMPVIWVTSLVVLAAIIPLRKRQHGSIN